MPKLSRTTSRGRIARATVIAVLLVLTGSSSVLAYHLLGGKWYSPTPLSYYFYTAVGADVTAYKASLNDWYNTPTAFT